MDGDLVSLQNKEKTALVFQLKLGTMQFHYGNT